MAEGEDGQDRTEAATAHHLDQAREQGRVPISREATTVAGLVAVVGVLWAQYPAMTRRLLLDMSGALRHLGDVVIVGQVAEVRSVLTVLVVPVLAVAVVAAAASVLGQTGFLLHVGALQPQISRVNPTAGLKRVFGFNGLVELVKSLAKLGLNGVAMWIAVRGDWDRLMRLPWAEPNGLLGAVARPVWHLLVATVLVQVAIAGADLFWVRYSHARDLRMSKQDIRDEMKDTEGNPHIKARFRRIRVLRARRRMMAKVPTATVVVTNPTHYAVAIAYDRAKHAAPRVVAKGMDGVAARIREIAAANAVPIVPNPPLARALHAVELDAEIPAEYYKAVAAIIAYVWRLKGAGSRR